MKTAVKDVMTTRVVWVKKGGTQPVPAGRTVAIVSNVASAGCWGHLVKTISPYGSFPLSACPPACCPACGECVNSCKDCVACGEFDPDLECECSVYMPPRTASLIHAMAENYCDMIHDLAEDIPSAIPLKPHDDLWPVPEAAWWQSRDFYRKFARRLPGTSCRPGAIQVSAEARSSRKPQIPPRSSVVNQSREVETYVQRNRNPSLPGRHARRSDR